MESKKQYEKAQATAVSKEHNPKKKIREEAAAENQFR